VRTTGAIRRNLVKATCSSRLWRSIRMPLACSSSTRESRANWSWTASSPLWGASLAEPTSGSKRTLTVLKTQASLHEPQIREFTITDKGITLGGEILGQSDAA
jgi:hypothetical protein